MFFFIWDGVVRILEFIKKNILNFILYIKWIYIMYCTSPSQIKSRRLSNFFKSHIKIHITFSTWINLSGTE
uniref:Uncharacterized protein n=1 Tax=viral metagenome TaxID=1070528 RepID=A0A6C0AEJ7_9ZZZZ